MNQIAGLFLVHTKTGRHRSKVVLGLALLIINERLGSMPDIKGFERRIAKVRSGFSPGKGAGW